MQTIDPALVTSLAAVCAAALMVEAGIAKRQLARRLRRANRVRKRWRP
jgi:hypothetical protein